MSCFINKSILISVVFIHSVVCFVPNDSWENSNSMENCTCVPPHLCPNFVTNLEIELRIHRKSDQKFCEEDSDIKCCTELLDVTQNMEFLNQKLDQKFLEKSSKNEDTSKFDSLKKCGLKNYSYMHWSAALLHQKSKCDLALYKCGVSLIHKRVALTAAHCLEDKKGFWSVKIGEKIRKARKIILHPFFNSTSLENNIGLIILNKPFPRKIGTVCITNKKYSYFNNINRRCQSASWSSDSNFDKPVSYLRIASVSVVPKTKLGELLGFEAFSEEHYNSICAAEGDNCRTAAGNPLFCPIPGQSHRLHQVGVGSYGPQGCQNGSLGVYSNLPAFRRWIDKMMIKNGFGIDTYRY